MSCCEKNVSGKQQTVIQRHFSKKELTNAIHKNNSQCVDNRKIIHLISYLEKKECSNRVALW
jgi:hypothetical protein